MRVPQLEFHSSWNMAVHSALFTFYAEELSSQIIKANEIIKALVTTSSS